jgi:cytidylate kinase
LLEPPYPELRWYRVVLAQGWKRQIRRMFEAVGMPVRRLVRVRVGSLKLTDLPVGQARRLTHQEMTQLASCARATTTTRPTRPARADAPGQAAADTVEPAPVEPQAVAPRRIVVAIDGPSSSGKSTVGAEAARLLGYRFCDTGLLYRAVAWLALDRGVEPSDTAALVPLAAEVTLVADSRGRLGHVHVDGATSLRGNRSGVDRAVSSYAKVAELRAALVTRQRILRRAAGSSWPAATSGPSSCPDADVKIYLNASAEERARRRAAQRRTTDETEAGQILDDLRRRDSIDSSRETAPLRTAADAVIINTDGNSFDQTVDAVMLAISGAQSRGDSHAG